jgi:hypothetical protein
MVSVLIALAALGAVAEAQAVWVGDNDDFDTKAPGAGTATTGDVLYLPWREMNDPEEGNTDVILRTSEGDAVDMTFPVGAAAPGDELTEAILSLKYWDVNDWRQAPDDIWWGAQDVVIRVEVDGYEEVLRSLTEVSGRGIVVIDEYTMSPGILDLLQDGGDLHLFIGPDSPSPETDCSAFDYGRLDLTYEPAGGGGGPPADESPVPEAGAGLALVGGLAGLASRRRRRS